MPGTVLAEEGASVTLKELISSWGKEVSKRIDTLHSTKCQDRRTQLAMGTWMETCVVVFTSIILPAFSWRGLF